MFTWCDVNCASLLFVGVFKPFHQVDLVRLAGTRMSAVWILLELRIMELVNGNNWSDKKCKTPAKLSPPTNQHPYFYRPDALPVAWQTVSEHWRESWASILITTLPFLLGTPLQEITNKMFSKTAVVYVISCWTQKFHPARYMKT